MATSLHTSTHNSSRGMTIAEAAAWAGVSRACYDAARLRGDYPQPTLPGRRIDRVLLEQCMNRLSNITPQSDPEDPLSAWERKRHARQA